MFDRQVKERRIFRRYNLEVPAEIHFSESASSEQQSLRANVANISGGGAFIASSRMVPLAWLTEIDLHLPFAASHLLKADRLPIHLKGHIIRCGEKGFAIQFDEQSPCYCCI